MDRKAIIAVTLSVLLLIGSQYYLFKYGPKPPPTAPKANATATPSPAAESSPAPAVVATPPVPVPEAAPEQRETLANEHTEYVFTSKGGGIAEATLLQHIAEYGEKIAMNRGGKIPIGALSREPGVFDEASSFQMRRSEDNQQVIFELAGPDQVRVRKTFTILPTATEEQKYQIRLEVEHANQGPTPVERPARFLHLGSAMPIHANDMPTYTGFDWFRKGSANETNVTWFGAGHIPLIGIQTSAERPEYRNPTDSVRWAAVKNQYFTTLATLPEATGTNVWARRFALPDSTTNFGIEGALGLPGFTLAAGETKREVVDLYIGPKEYQRLSKLGSDQDEVLHFGMFAIVSKFLLKSMNWLHNIVRDFGGYAMAIIILTLLIKSALWPLQNKATNSMKRMQLVQPKVAELREKYKDDPTKMNTEMMRIYKEYGVNPFGGCLPMLVQIPIFFGFYSMLGTAIELRNSRFLWVDDLSQPDTVFHLAGIPINILPLVMAGTMFWQMANTPKTGDPMQQRILMFMPLIFIAFSYNFAAALALYWTVQNIFSIVQLYLTRNQVAPTLAKITPTPAKKSGGKKR